MTVHSVTVILGYRLTFTAKQYNKFMKDNREMFYYEKGKDNEEDSEEENVEDNHELFEILETFLENQVKNSTVNTVTCCHLDEGEDAVKIFDIGIPVGEYSIIGEQDIQESFSYSELKEAIQEFDKLDFSAFKKHDVWNYVNEQEPGLWGLADDCLYCS